MEKIVKETTGGVVKTTAYEKDSGDLHVQYSQEVEGILDHNKAMANAGLKKDPTFGYYVGSVPLVVIEEWSRIAGVNVLKPENEQVLMRFLNDRDYAHFRVWNGHV